jgi:hypothetical protein
MRAMRRLTPSWSAVLLAVVATVCGEAALAASQATDLLAARGMTEAQYLERMPPVFK